MTHHSADDLLKRLPSPSNNTKKLWVNSGAHIFNDWLIILINVLVSSLAQP